MMDQEPNMTAYICRTCGTQFPPAEHPPRNCPICEDERQYVGWQGQQWTTLQALQRFPRATASSFAFLTLVN